MRSSVYLLAHSFNSELVGKRIFLKISQDQAVQNHSAPVEMPTEMPDSRMAGWPVLLLRPLNDAIAKGEFSERFCIRRKMRINVCLYCH